MRMGKLFLIIFIFCCCFITQIHRTFVQNQSNGSIPIFCRKSKSYTSIALSIFEKSVKQFQQINTCVHLTKSIRGRPLFHDYKVFWCWNRNHFNSIYAHSDLYIL